jgi:hypothetical protein
MTGVLLIIFVLMVILTVLYNILGENFKWLIIFLFFLWFIRELIIFYLDGKEEGRFI